MSVPQIISWCLIFLNAILLVWNGLLLKKIFELREQAFQNLKDSEEILEYSKQFSEKYKENENDERKNEYPSSTDGIENT